jgi:hypothetical protein
VTDVLEAGRGDLCHWCGSRAEAPRGPVSGIRRCSDCGVASTHPWPTDAELDAAYDGWYRPAEGRFQGPGDRLFRRLRARLVGRVDRIAPPGPVLDVGAGDGSLVDAFTAVGREAVGLERGGTPHPKVRSSSVDEVGGSWAAIIFWHSLEHLRAPRAALDAACRLLLAGGVLVIAVPNARSLQARLFGDRWFALDLPRHLVHLHPAALVDRLEQQGMTVTTVSHTRGGQGLFGWLHGLVAMLPGHHDLYDAIRRPGARQHRVRTSSLVLTIVLAVLVLPVAVVGYALETVAHRGGSIYVEARR